MGGDIRTGLEVVLYYRKVEIVQSNVQLLTRMVSLAKELGRDLVLLMMLK